MDLKLKGKKALITGASSGLGFAAALALSAEGAVVYINSRSEERLKFAAELIEKNTGNKPNIIAGDIATNNGLASIEKAISGIDILVSNAGGPPPGQFTTHKQQQWDEAYNLVFTSAQRLTQLVLPDMVERKWGRLIYITSIGVLQPVDDLILSNSFRAAVTGMCKTISNNYAKYGITANCVCPGYTATERLKSLAKQQADESGVTPDQILAQFTAMIPAGRVGQPGELASLITFLASEKAAYITGTSIPVDGGVIKGLL